MKQLMNDKKNTAYCLQKILGFQTDYFVVTKVNKISFKKCLHYFRFKYKITLDLKVGIQIL